MNTLITICARGGSKGIPGKNIKPLAGVPLIQYTVEAAKRVAQKYNADIAISTDDSLIKATCEQLNIFSNYTRPQLLATDNAGKIETIKDLLIFEEKSRSLQYDFILDLDVTSPLRTLEDIVSAFELLNSNKDSLTLFSVNPAARNPYFNMVEAADDGFYKLSKKLADSTITTRQSAPKVYDLNASFYWYRRSFFNLQLTSPITQKSLIYEMKHICFDLDHPIDFDFLEYLIVNKKLGFEF